MDLVEVPDIVNLEYEVSLDTTEESERSEKDETLSMHLMKLEGVAIIFPHIRLKLDPLLRQWNIPIVKRHTKGQ